MLRLDVHLPISSLVLRVHGWTESLIRKQQASDQFLIVQPQVLFILVIAEFLSSVPLSEIESTLADSHSLKPQKLTNVLKPSIFLHAVVSASQEQI